MRLDITHSPYHKLSKILKMVFITFVRTLSKFVEQAKLPINHDFGGYTKLALSFIF